MTTPDGQAKALFTAVVDHAQTLGLFERVNGHEPKNAPGSGLTAAVWVQKIGPVPRESGLAATTGRVEFSLRIYTNMLAEPQDEIDPAVTGACLTLIGVYSGDFDLGLAPSFEDGMFVDLLGAYGDPLAGQAGYLNQDAKLYRVMTVTLPLIVGDLWQQHE